MDINFSIIFFNMFSNSQKVFSNNSNLSFLCFIQYNHSRTIWTHLPLGNHQIEEEREAFVSKKIRFDTIMTTFCWTKSSPYWALNSNLVCKGLINHWHSLEFQWNIYKLFLVITYNLTYNIIFNWFMVVIIL